MVNNSMVRRTVCAAIAASALVVATAALSAGPFHCDGCGCEAPCCKVCRLVEEEKSIKVVCWGAKCEEFVVNGRSCKRCSHCEELCTEGPDGEPICCCTRKTAWSIWDPWKCPTVYTKTKLMKKTVTKKVPSFRWVIEDLCADCERNAESALAKKEDIPPKPAEAKGAKAAPAARK